MERSPSGSLRLPATAPSPVPRAAAFLLAYLLLDWVSFIHPFQQSGITPWNPQPALAIALLMRGGPAWSPLVFAAALLAECVVRGAAPLDPAAILVAAALTVAYVGIARALCGPLRVDPALGRARDVGRLVVGVSVGTFLAGMLYLAAIGAAGATLADPVRALLRFWVGDAVGILVTLPIILMASAPARRASFMALVNRRETLVHVAFTTLALGIVLGSAPGEQVRFFYVLFLPLVLVAARLGLAGASLMTLVIQAAVIVTGELAHYQAITVVELQALLIALTVTGLFLGVTVDERHRAEEELRRSMRLASAGEMAAALAHELNQPLTAVASYARASRTIARERPGDVGLLSDTLEKLLAESSRAADVVRRLRDFFRTGALQLAPVDLAEAARQCLENARSRAEAAGVALRPGPAERCAVLADRVQVEIVLRNLMANALEAARDGQAPREVGIEIAPDADRVTLTVTDSGAGVAAGEEERIFEPFETTRASGMGMGLAISRAVVEAHGGRLWAEAAPHGRFHLALPVAERGHG